MVGAAMYFLLFVANRESIGGSDSDNICGGEERWDVKVMADGSADSFDKTIETTTIAKLLAINTTNEDTKYKKGRARMDIEKHVYQIKHCFITDILREDDNDLHLVIEDGKKNHMIAEIPDPKCKEAKKSEWTESFDDARSTLLQYANNYRHHLFTVTGVLFVDRSHRQTGRAPNNVELHPIIELKEEKKINPIEQ